MTPKEQLSHISNVLSINDGFANPYAGIWSSVCWRTDEEYAPATFWVNCNDLFFWGCADCEDITPENFPMLLRTVNEVAAILDVSDPMVGDIGTMEEFKAQREAWKEVGAYAADLWCARARGMRPQKPCYQRYPEELVPLFDACGPEREEEA